MGLADFVNSIITKDQFSQTFNKFDRSVSGAGRSIDKLAGGMGMLFAGIAGAAGVAALGKTALELGNLGAQSLVTRDSFASVTQSVGKSTALLDEMKVAAGGTIDEMRLMQLANTALAGASGETGAAFAELIPRLIEGARAANKLNPSLGDTEFLFQSLVTGIKRGSPLLIDNTGITLSIAEANQRMADSLGKSVTALTEEEKQLALMGETAKGVDRILAQSGGSLDTMATSADKLKVAFQNLKVVLGETIAPLTSGLQANLATELDVIAAKLSGDAGGKLAAELQRARTEAQTYQAQLVQLGDASGRSAEKLRNELTRGLAEATQRAADLEEQIRKLANEEYRLEAGSEAARWSLMHVGTSATIAANQIGTLTFSLRQAKEAAQGLGGSMAGLPSEYKAGLNSAFGQIFGMGSAIPAAEASAMYSDYTRQYAQLELDKTSISKQEYTRRKADLDASLAEQLNSYRKFSSDVGGVASSMSDDLKSKIGSALTPTFDLSSLTGGLLGGAGGNAFDEAYKRLAAVALRPEELQIHAQDWATTFDQAGLTGLSPEAAQAEAKRLVEAYSKGLDFSLIDREAIKNSVRQAIKAEELYNSIVDEIYAEMGKDKAKVGQAGASIGKQINKGMIDEAKSGAKDVAYAYLDVMEPEIIRRLNNRNRRSGQVE